MIKLFFYNLSTDFFQSSHLHDQNFFCVVNDELEADFLFICLTNQELFFHNTKNFDLYKNKKIILYNLTEPISFGAAEMFYDKCLAYGINSKDIFFHSTNHFLDKFNCLHKGLSITDHIVKSQLDTGFIDFDERFLKFTFINNTVRTPRALVLNEMINRNLNYNQSYITYNGDFWYGDKNIQKFKNLKENNKSFQSHDYKDVTHTITKNSDKSFQSVYKNSFFNFTIETFSDFGMDNEGFNSHLTEKTIRNFSHKLPFLLLISSEEQLRIIEDLGFVLFNDLFGFKITTNVSNTIKDYVDVIETISKMSSNDVKKMILSKEYKQIIEHNYNQYLYYKNLNIENIYRYILMDSYEDKNIKIKKTFENKEKPIFSIISSEI